MLVVVLLTPQAQTLNNTTTTSTTVTTTNSTTNSTTALMFYIIKRIYKIIMYYNHIYFLMGITSQQITTAMTHIINSAEFSKSTFKIALLRAINYKILNFPDNQT